MRSWMLILPLMVGCKKEAPEAPKELADLGLFFMAHFEDEDPGELGAAVINLAPWVRDADYEADLVDRALAMPVLDGDNLGGLSIPPGADASLQTPVALAGISKHALDKQYGAMFEKNRVCLSSDSTVWAERSMDEGDDCLKGGGCELASGTTEERKETLIADVWIDSLQEYRHIDAEDADGNVVEAVVSRNWTEKVFAADGNGDKSWDQQFSLEVYIADGSNTLRWSVFWSSVTLPIGDDYYVGLVREGLDQSFEFTESFLAGGVSDDCGNDRNLAKPDR
jgi:hypothetical protein